jgi:hypothetical protein
MYIHKSRDMQYVDLTYGIYLLWIYNSPFEN